MRNYIILNGTNSNTITGLLIQELAPISKPLMRTEIEEIDGRNGDIVTPLGFSAYDKEITIGLYGSYDINQIIAYFNSEGTVIFSNEPDKYYNYTIYQQIDFERLVRFKTATVTLHCQPFKYGTTGESTTLGDGSMVSGEGSSIVLENTQLAPFATLDLKGNTEQNGTPTPSAPVAVQTVTGENVVQICGKNLFDSSATPDYVAQQAWAYFGNGTYTAITNGYYFESGYRAIAFEFDSLTVGQQYTLSFDAKGNSSHNAQVGVNMYSGASGGTQKNYTIETTSARISFTFTATSANRIAFNSGSTSGADLTITNIQLELGSATAYEPYQGQSYEVNLGKNLINFSSFQQSWGGASVNGEGTTITMSPNTSGSMGLLYDSATYSVSIPAGQMIAWSRTWAGGGTWESGTFTFPLKLTYADGTTETLSFGDTTENNYSQVISATKTLTKSVVSVKIESGGCFGITNLSAPTSFNLQLEYGTATTYAPYFTPIELCKIGDYQDYIWKDGDTWKVHKAIGTLTLTGSSSEGWSSTGTNVFATTNGAITGSKYPPLALCRYATFNPVQSGVTGTLADGEFAVQYNDGSNSRVFFKNTAISTVGDFETWASTNTPKVYYALATPTDTAITNEALIAQLNEIDQQAHAYKVRTHINAQYATGNVPLVLTAETAKNIDSTITNAGNIYSRPRLTIYGQGNVGIYLGGVQMFEIALGSLGHITLDTELMEAYKDTTDNLQNRAVTGDYSNFKLSVGQNQLTFSGIVTECIVENYSRWL